VVWEGPASGSMSAIFLGGGVVNASPQAVVGIVFWGGAYDKRFLRHSEQGLRARLNGVLLSIVSGW